MGMWLMSDLVQADDMSDSVYLYDIDMEAAKHNEISRSARYVLNR